MKHDFLVRSFHQKFSRINGTSEKAVLFFLVETSQRKLVFHLQISRLSHQSQAFCGILHALLQLRWQFSLLTPEFTMNYMNAKKCSQGELLASLMTVLVGLHLST